MKLSEPIAEGRIAEIYPWEDGKVVKLAHDWVPPLWLDYEYHISKIVHATGLNVPEPFEQVLVDGRSGIVYQRVDGPTMLAQMGTAPHKIRRYGRMLGELHAEMHTKPGATDLPDLHARLEGKICAAKEVPDPISKAALVQLTVLPTGDRLLHGDFHPDNVVMAASGPVAIDWSDAARGHPLGDVARTWVLSQVGGIPQNGVLRLIISFLRNIFLQTYLRTYFQHAPYKRAELDAWLLPVAVARLEENIESEQEISYKLIQEIRESRNQKLGITDPIT